MGQKCEGNLRYQALVWDIFGVYLQYNFFKSHDFTVLYIRNLLNRMVITLLSLLSNFSNRMQSLLSFLNEDGANNFFE